MGAVTGKVSIHASAREATRRHGLGSSTPTRFRSTPPRGRRLVPFAYTGLIPGFRSTPPRGRRHPMDGSDVPMRMFRSTPPRGRRLFPFPSLAWEAEFRSTPPRGRRPDRDRPSALPHRFDPRLREGGDRRSPGLPPNHKVSIHASAREATFQAVRQGRNALFRSTPPRGRRPRPIGSTTGLPMFRSTPPRGRRLPGLLGIFDKRAFRSTPPRGRRLASACISSRMGGFRSTPPRGRRL